jgi:hypothetical protein
LAAGAVLGGADLDARPVDCRIVGKVAARGGEIHVIDENNIGRESELALRPRRRADDGDVPFALIKAAGEIAGGRIDDGFEGYAQALSDESAEVDRNAADLPSAVRADKAALAAFIP